MDKKFNVYYKWIPFQSRINNPIVFIHGYLETQQIWYQLNLSALKRPILLVDIPGHGYSELNINLQPTIRNLAQPIVDLINFYQITTCSIVGHSLGAYVGLEMMQQITVQKLVLLNSNFWNDSIQKQKDRERVAEILKKHKATFIQEAIPNLFLAPEKHASQVSELIQRAQKGRADYYAYASIAMKNRLDYSSFAEANSCKIHIIQGEQDHIMPLKTMQRKTQHFKVFDLIKKSGHMSLFEQANEVMNILKRILA